MVSRSSFPKVRLRCSRHRHRDGRLLGTHPPAAYRGTTGKERAGTSDMGYVGGKELGAAASRRTEDDDVRSRRGGKYSRIKRRLRTYVARDLRERSLTTMPSPRLVPAPTCQYQWSQGRTSPRSVYVAADTDTGWETPWAPHPLLPIAAPERKGLAQDDDVRSREEEIFPNKTPTADLCSANNYVPLFIRLLNIAFTTTTLAVGISTRNLELKNNILAPSGAHHLAVSSPHLPLFSDLALTIPAHACIHLAIILAFSSTPHLARLRSARLSIQPQLNVGTRDVTWLNSNNRSTVGLACSTHGHSGSWDSCVNWDGIVGFGMTACTELAPPRRVCRFIRNKPSTPMVGYSTLDPVPPLSGAYNPHIHIRPYRYIRHKSRQHTRQYNPHPIIIFDPG
ncbi:transmembrane protein, putative [Rhizoctonia solani]|uniref:Transmembrane protein, putative n=1 Tax=Rhizoctonia solani TaxID=456999 RepID=A0A8H8T365_9AGAM|nr:uncharacterized protein RhiXN_12208 [Rhizoctonia solani]QRW26547.1 transmembrane protein, putative [Rhizoctonia solani]